MVQLSGLFERVQAEGAAGIRLLVGVPLHLTDRFSADALELTAAKVTDKKQESELSKIFLIFCIFFCQNFDNRHDGLL